MSADVRGLYAALEVDLPAGGSDVPVNCPDPDHEDRRASASVNTEHGAWCCHGCSAKGGPYDAAVLLGRTPAEAMALLERFGLVESTEGRRNGGQPKPRPVPEEAATRQEAAPKRCPYSDADVARWQENRRSREDFLERVWELRGWTPEALELAGVGYDPTYTSVVGGPVTFPIRDEHGALTAVVHYQPNPERVPEDGRKSRARGGRGLFPAPELFDPAEPLFVVEGEGDAVSLLSVGGSAVGVGGVNGWRDEWAPRFKGRRVIVCCDCDEARPGHPKGGREFAEEIAAALKGHAEEVRVLDLDPERHDGYDVGDLVRDTPPEDRARLKDDLMERQRVPKPDAEGAEGPHSQERATVQHPPALAREPDILSRFVRALPSVGLVGEERTAQIIYLATTSRLFAQPVSVAVKGPSSVGKSHAVKSTLRFFPASAYHSLTGMSERHLVYDEEPLKHRMIVMYEIVGMASEWASYLIRTLLSEGRIRHGTTEDTKGGRKGRVIEREGPTGLIVTTTEIQLHPENETRLLSIPADDTPEQTRKVIHALMQEGEDVEPELTEWLALQRWLETGERRVTLPFRYALAELAPAMAVRVRRDLGMVRQLIRAHAFLHRASRPRDEKGQIVATLDDYETVAELVGPLVAEGLDATVSPETRETVDAVGRLSDDYAEGVPLGPLAEALELDKSTVSRRVRVARNRGYLRNMEDRKGRPLRLVVGDAMPDQVQVLPSRAELEECCTVARLPESAPEPAADGNGYDPDDVKRAESELARLAEKGMA